MSTRRASFIDSVDNGMTPLSGSEQLDTAHSRLCTARNPVSNLSTSHSRSLSSSNKTVTPIPPNLLPSAPASPPTPAPSPTPHQRPQAWQYFDEDEDSFLLNARIHFSSLTGAKKQRFLEGVLGLCDSQLLSFVSSYVGPRLRKDPFQAFPTELCLRVLSFIDDPKTLARASQVSSRWRELLSDDITWKNLCEKHAYASRRLSDDRDFIDPFHTLPPSSSTRSLNGLPRKMSGLGSSDGTFELPRSASGDWLSLAARKRRARPLSYRSHFKQKYMVESAWNKGGHCTQRHITPDQGVVTSLHLTSKYIVLALDNAKIHVYDTNGNNQKTLQGHVMGVWAMVPWDDILVSGGCDREVRVWNMATGAGIYLLRGHTSTVRCLKMSDKNTAISGSRDTTLRIWDLTTGNCRNVLVGHQASVRCLAIHGDIVVSGSYDTTARIWSISEGRCQRTLSGHFSQIYAIAFDGRRIATGSLDTSVRIWDPQSGQCHAILQGHTSLVGQLQMRGDTLVTGGSDGSVRVWSLTKMAPIHRLAAHDNSVTSLQFDSSRIVSGGSDGRVKVWSLQTGQLLRELSTPAESVWRVAFEDEKAVILANRSGRTVMEVWTFSPPEEDGDEDAIIESTSSTPGLRLRKEISHDDLALNSSRSARHRTMFSDPPPTIPLEDDDDDDDDDQAMPDAPIS
ncbi:F-box/WD repeat-containing protein [Aspergillus clavatus NRRL 1]|uniref:Mitochondrial division protein 1 n=1 Tax=Aspergillus clavatus (strain ATCC 1007 / CBS 513.65 / DSM 816 / NCTC 3887 / NRRL 1 / QM 1276 / 107) TaxID=344612 RepID=A1C6P1_ASPCL|nr:F-box and WD repeat-containing protein [Aspergillus clavatus NRRL 1]EAW14062.1 F-box and WD repeat-containing protein [Aspergillus clavatus NRRL 1]